MATIVTRAGKGSALSHTEMDANFSNLNTDKAELAGATFTGTVNLTSAFQIGGVAVTSTAAELNALDGITSTVSELNILDGVTSTTAELNILDGVTATATELNIMDGITPSTTELNYVNGVTSAIQTQINASYRPGGTDVAVSDGGTGSSTSSGARSNLGLGTLATLSSVAAGQIDANSVNHSEISFGSTTSTFSAGTGTTVIPEGFHWLYHATDGAALAVQVNVSGSFITTGTIDSPVFCYSDGTNMRINNTSGSSKTISYRRLG